MSKNPFAMADAVSDHKRDVIRTRELLESDYSAFVINRSMSYHADAVLYANDMNCMPGLPAQLQFDFMRESLRPRKRFAKWAKADTSEVEEAICSLYGYNHIRAREAASVLRHDQIKTILEKHARNK